MNKKLKTSKIAFVAALLLAGFMHVCAFAQQYTQKQFDLAALSTNINPKLGTYYAIAQMTNSAGTYWITPSNGVSSCTFQDVSGFPPPYTWAAMVQSRNFHQFVATNNTPLTFPATNTMSYTLTVYVTSPLPPPTNGQALTLQAQWQ